MKYLSVCSGIEAASVAWPAWSAVAFAEIDKFPSAVLAHHYPNVPNWGDMNEFKQWPDADPDVLVGGTPCQSFSVAGLRRGLDDPRGNLTLTYLAIADRYRPRWVVWENVPGVLSDDDGRTFGTFLGGLGELGYGFAYRVLDAQYFGLAQRRKRVFVVGCLGDWRRAAAVLLERECLSGNPAPSREARARVAGTLGGSSQEGGFRTTDIDNSGAFITNGPGGELSARDAKGPDTPLAQCTLVAFDETQITHNENRCIAIQNAARGKDQNGLGIADPGEPMFTLDQASQHAIAFESRFARNGRGAPEEVCQPLKAQSGRTGKGDSAPLIAFSDLADPIAANQARTDTREGTNNNGLAVAFEPRYYTRDNKTGGAPSETATLTATAWKAGDAAPHVSAGMQVRRLTPRECARLQGFPDDYLDITYRGKPAADGPRYKALGNSMAVPVMRWIGERIAKVSSVA